MEKKYIDGLYWCFYIVEKSVINDVLVKGILVDDISDEYL